MQPMNHLKGAVFSEDFAYRYALWRIWQPSLPWVLFIGLNPSIADGTTDDPTLRRCIRFAQQWGYGGLLLGNLFAWRATYPHELAKVANPMGKENGDWLVWLGKNAGTILLCWGNYGRYQNRAQQLLPLLSNPCYHLGLTQKGEPRHPLYVPASATPQLYIPTESAKLPPVTNHVLPKEDKK